MKRVAIGLLSLVVLAILITALVAPAPSDKAYTADQLHALLQQPSQTWASRIVSVRGWAHGYDGTGCTTRGWCRTRWLDVSSDSSSWFASRDLTIVVSPGPRVQGYGDLHIAARLSLLPIIGPRLFRWSGSDTLRVRLTASSPVCFTTPPSLCPGTILAP